MLADQYRDFLEATTGAVLPPVSTTTRGALPLRRSTAATAAKVKEVKDVTVQETHTTHAIHADEKEYRRSAMLEALAGLNDQPSQAPVQEQPLPAAMALTATEMFTSALTSMGQPGQQVPSRPSPPLLRDALRQSEGKNFLLQRMLAASSGLANPCSLLN
ncbi:unnamed protein product [Symbiodinium natans]|uniref:Uncharacterized protein n=1 Tax=Symbiodinium natans TaxID=878477 RepID=A0A812SDP7_9DINO|nr:unnamed protein product [Symbiodinium natans]